MCFFFLNEISLAIDKDLPLNGHSLDSFTPKVWPGEIFAIQVIFLTEEANAFRSSHVLHIITPPWW